MTQISLPRTAGRAGLAAAAAAFLAFGLAAPAAADTVRAEYTHNAEQGSPVEMNGRNFGTNLFNLRLEDGSDLTMYCIDLETGIRGGAWYVEDGWETYEGDGEFNEPARIHWILQHSYPRVSTTDLAAAAEIDSLSEEDALAATQAAIWHFSNGANLTGSNDAIEAVYNYLVEKADDLPQTSEPDASLSITPDMAEGVAGSTVGEFTIETSADSVPVVIQVPEGVTLVDLETDEPVGDTVENGDKVGFEVSADAEAGQASFSLETTAEVATGRLFRGAEGESKTQTLITAEGGETTVSASASATWTAGEEPSPSPSPSEEPSESPEPSPTPSESPSTPASPEPSNPADDRDEPSLPVTGGALAGLVAAGIAALGAGGGAIYLSRKRKAAGASTES
ncbi:thioester domain-containing protein [Nocardiopsis sp. CC223A]|uniref:thioester domain-containing protein n=1 Tax=Nocardiopsis sp. CC223A TaxID=3044051 RepID=UPI00278C7769|nr:thioester domain-containing protein [Nocardiopsis sp. CC223A]